MRESQIERRKRIKVENPTAYELRKKKNRDWMRNQYHSDPVAKIRRLESSKKWQLANPDKVKQLMRTRKLFRKFGITPEQYEIMLREQHGVCALCCKPPMNIRLAVDHCHKTKRVRGLLCRQCNQALGFVEKWGLVALNLYLIGRWRGAIAEKKAA